jgi:hypothetical protein
MIRLEQVRGEMLERFERVDRRFAQNEQRLGRMEQRFTELSERIEALRVELLAQLELLSWAMGGGGRRQQETGDRRQETGEERSQEQALL